MRAIAAAMLAVLPAAGAVWAQTAPAASPEPGAPATAPAEAAPPAPPEDLAPEEQAARSLCHSAVSLANGAGRSPARIRRLRIDLLGRFAERLAPNDPEVLWLRANALKAGGAPAKAAPYLLRYLRKRPGDYAGYVDWLDLRLEPLQTAAARAKVLAGVLKDTSRPEAVRAEAAVRLAEIERGQGDANRAGELFDRARQLDPYHPQALAGLLSLMDDPGVLDRLKTGLDMLRGDPSSVDTAASIGRLLGEIGAYDQAVRFDKHAFELAEELGETVAEPMRAAYVGALLDANQPGAAIKVATGTMNVGPELRWLLAEAYAQGTSGAGRRASLVMRMEQDIAPRDPNADLPAGRARDLAWFYLQVKSDPQRALRYAEQAWRKDPNAEGARLTLGAAEVLGGRRERGRELLSGVLEADPENVYAMLYLMRYHDEMRNTAKVAEYAGRIAKRVRSGPVARQMRRLAARRDVTVAEHADLDEAQRLAGQFPEDVLKLALRPQEFLKVSLQPLGASTGVGEPVRLRAVLTNTSTLRVPLGRWGLFRPVLALRAAVGEGIRAERFGDLPLAIWPAPRYLEKGQSVSDVVRVDVGSFGQFLLADPLGELPLRFNGVVDPLAAGGRVYSVVPGLVPETVEAFRRSLLNPFPPAGASAEEWRQSYTRSLGRVVYRIKKGSLAERLRAARRIAGLLAATTAYEDRTARAPGGLEGKLDRGLPLRLMVEILKDDSPIVRAEMLAALQVMKLDTGVIRWFGPIIEDPSPLVRFRLAETLGASQLAGQEPVLKALTEDKDALVREMAEVFVATPAR